MIEGLKDISNPYSTGGGGVNFENEIQTSFVVLMLAGGFLPCLPGKMITKLKLQCKRDGFNIDDIVAFTNDIQTNSEYKLLAQIKHDISVTDSDEQFQEVIAAAWADFKNPSLFNKGKDIIALITGPLSKSDIYDTRIILDWARHSEDEKDYFQKKIKLLNFCSKAKQNKVEVFRNALKKANSGKNVSDDLIFSFLKHFYLIGYDLDIKNGVIHSLLTSIITQFQPAQAISVWARISKEVSSYNQNAGTVTKENLPKEIIDFFKKEKVNTIPDDFVKPEIRKTTGIEEKYKKSLFIASILGGWNENFQGDNDIINIITQENSKMWINDIQEIKSNNNEICTINSGNWQVEDKIDNLSKYASLFYDNRLDLIKDISLKVLSEIHPKFDLKSEDRFASTIYGKYPKYSSGLRKGIAETLVFLSIHEKELKSCTLHKPTLIVCLTIKELFNNSDWKLWASLNDILPILAEADPEQFLSSVENALKQSPCPFIELFNQESVGIANVNYMAGLYWALETLAWSEEYLSRSILALAGLAELDPGGSWVNRPDNSIVKILLPWLPQTTAPFEKRIASVKGIQRNFPDTAWKILVKLLPKQHQTSMYNPKPVFRKYIPTDWKEAVTGADYWKQIEEYAAMSVDMVKENINYVCELVDNLDNIPQPSYDDFLGYLSSDEIFKLSDEQKLMIWEKLKAFAEKHRYFADAKWALSAENVDKLEEIAKKISPLDPELSNRHLFSNIGFDFMDRNDDLKTNQEKILSKRIEAIKQIYEVHKTASVVAFAEKVENPTIVGDIFAHIANEENDSEFLPLWLNFQNGCKKHFIYGYIWTRYSIVGIEWIERLHIVEWSNEQKCNFFLNLPFENEIWEKANEILGSYISEYWKKINANPFPIRSNLLPAIENLLKYERPRFAFSCIYAHYFLRKELFKEQAIKALIDGVSSDEPFERMDSYRTIEIIKKLQETIDINENDLFNIEWVYLPIFNSYDDVKPKFLEKYLSVKPEFFVKMIQLVYRSKNDDTPEKNEDEQIENKINNAWKLLDNWTHPPGKMADGSFSIEALKKWIDEVKEKTIKSGHFEVAMEHLGNVLFYVGADPNGLWIQQSVAEILDEKDNDYICQGFTSEVMNSRGVHFVDPSGEPEKKLANLWKKNMEDVENLGLIHFASSLKQIVKSYEHEAEQVISRYSTKQENENNDGATNDQ
jgi:hypothetical protein